MQFWRPRFPPIPSPLEVICPPSTVCASVCCGLFGSREEWFVWLCRLAEEWEGMLAGLPWDSKWLESCLQLELRA